MLLFVLHGTHLIPLFPGLILPIFPVKGYSRCCCLFRFQDTLAKAKAVLLPSRNVVVVVAAVCFGVSLASLRRVLAWLRECTCCWVSAKRALIQGKGDLSVQLLLRFRSGLCYTHSHKKLQTLLLMRYWPNEGRLAGPAQGHCV